MVRIEHVRNAQLCVAGAREWFKKYNLDFRVFLDTGLPASVIEGTGDEFGKRVAAIARREAQNG